MEKNKEERKSKNAKSEKVECSDKLCPTHGSKPLKLRGRIFTGVVVKKHHGRLAIEFERVLYFRKYERYEKRKTRVHARLPECMEKEINIGDLVEVGETRPISKIIHFVVVRKIRGNGEKEVEGEGK